LRRDRTEMLVYRYSRLLHWSECDPGGIIFSPNYLRWMIDGVTDMFLSFGIDPHRLLEGGLRCGLPVLEQQLRYRQAARLHDSIEHVIEVAKLGTKSLTFEHRMYRGETCLMEATDVRVWGVHPIANPEKLRALPIPEEIRAHLMGGA
jgi:4-hydroxybenzoyl-CoA thioesterase